MPANAPVMRSRDLVAIWILALVLAVPGLVFAFRYIHSIDVPQSQAFLDFNSGRVEDFAARTADGALGVVVMGDSRVRYGTELPDELETRLSAQVGREVVVLRLTYDWATFEDFEPLMPMILDAEPTLMILQEELRVKNRGYSASELMKREYLWWRLLGTGVWNPGGQPQEYYQTSMTCEAVGWASVADRRKRLDRWVDFDPDGRAARKVAAWEADLAARHIDLRFLTVPIATEAREGLPGVEPSGPPLGLTPAFELDDEHYCDFVHMDPVNRAAYTDWFVTAVASELTTEARPHSA